jgi:hypothetical protein
MARRVASATSPGESMRPRPDREMHPAAGVAQAAEVAHLAGQEGVIPAADEVDCRLDVLRPRR